MINLSFYHGSLLILRVEQRGATTPAPCSRLELKQPRQRPHGGLYDPILIDTLCRMRIPLPGRLKHHLSAFVEGTNSNV